MATVIHNTTPRTREDTGSGLGVILAVILVIALAVLLFVFGVPALRGNYGGSTINVPDKINVDVGGSAGGSTGGSAGGMTGGASGQ
jgi:hypothetical protein